MKQKSVNRLSARSLLITVYDEGPEPLSVGTGFIAMAKSGPFLLTARHVFTGRDHFTKVSLSKSLGIPKRIVIRHHVKKRLGIGLLKEEKLVDDNGNPLWYEYPEYPELVDVAALRLTDLEGIELYTTNLAPYKAEFQEELNSIPSGDDAYLRIQPAETVSVIGFPFGETTNAMFPIWNTGFIASEPDFDHFYKGMLIDCRARSGQSGSPVYAVHFGEYRASSGVTCSIDGSVYAFLGLYSGRINAESDLGMVWKAEAIKELINSIP